MMRALVMLGCLAAAALGKSLSEMTCTAADGAEYKQGETWMRDCNRCVCVETGEGGLMAACTIAACPKFSPCQLDDGTLVQPRESYTNATTGAQCVCHARNCRAGVQFVECAGEGLQQPIQCEAASDEEDEESNSISNEEEEDEEYEMPIIPECVGQPQGHQYMDDCNTCTCASERVAACTLMMCLPGMPGTPGMEEEPCAHRVLGEQFNKECNLCTCVEGEEGLAAECTEMSCHEFEEYEEPQVMDGCEGSSCDCPPGMTGIQPFCRPMEVTAEEVVVEEAGELIDPSEVQVSEPELHGGRVRPLGNQDLVPRPAGNPFQQGNQAGPAPGPGVHYQGGRVPPHNRPPMININEVHNPCEKPGAVAPDGTVYDEVWCRTCTCSAGPDGSMVAACPFFIGVGEGPMCRKVPQESEGPRPRPRPRPRPAVYPGSMVRFHNGQNPRPAHNSHAEQLKQFHPYGASLRT